ncbi:GNAT family N-acetyltransferase [Jiangella asiatica]|uniref:GNAT family N-acetyltransferase n=1 Tax=Jiangella asiatica TaxID=2530372 RepID=A0A4R5DPD9_9ACTN|nr:GNAT family N-acetyltransferase [Jiangella asiatica]TDE14054.1 GNAT family N-acetyltransferase [Jiangella asiatica]
MSEQPVADRSVRLAWAADTEAVGEVQARAWRGSYAELLPAAVLDDIDAAAFGAAWRRAVVSPPTARHRVLVALEAGRVVGFAATAPSEDPDAHPTDGEVVAFHIDPEALGEGHGSRLMAAVADTLRADGFTRGRIWLVVGDDALRGFLEPAGWAPDTAHRTLDLTGDGTTTLRQVRLHTDLTSDPAEEAP